MFFSLFFKIKWFGFFIFSNNGFGLIFVMGNLVIHQIVLFLVVLI